MRARRPLPAWAEIALLPLVNISLAFLTVGIIVRIIGADPLHALELLVVGAFGSPESIGYTLYYATNFIFTGLAVSVAFHGGLFNIGGEGQAYIGGLGCGLAVLALDRYLPMWLMIPVGIAAAALFGAAWAAASARSGGMSTGSRPSGRHRSNRCWIDSPSRPAGRTGARRSASDCWGSPRPTWA